MAERVVLRTLLYVVFGYSILGAAASDLTDNGRASYFLMSALVSLAALAVSAYDPRYDPRHVPAPKRPRED